MHNENKASKDWRRGFNKSLFKNYDNTHGQFCEERARVSQGGGHFHIGPDGTPAYETRFECVDDFREGLAAVKLDGKVFHIRPDGTPAYETRFDRAGPFYNGEASAMLDGVEYRVKTDGTMYQPAY